MDLFGSRRRQMESLEREVISNPTPQNMVALVDRYIAAGEESKALEVAKRAIERFPDSEQCITVYQNVRKTQLQTEIQELNQQLRKKPTMGVYEKLSTLYLHDLGNRNKALEIAMEGLTRFPNSDGLHLTCGLIRMERFHHDYLANDFTESVRHLEEARKVNPRNQKAAVDLVWLYAEVGAFAEAQALIETVLAMDPNMPGITEVKQKIQEHASEAVPYLDDALIEIEKKRGLGPLGLEIRKLFEPVPRGGTILQISPSKIEHFLQSYESLSGYKCSVVLGMDGGCLASHTRGDIARDRFLQVVQQIHSSLLVSAKKMDIGSLVGGEIETPLGRIVLAVWKNLVLALLADAPAKKEDVEVLVERFVGFAAVG